MYTSVRGTYPTQCMRHKCMRHKCMRNVLGTPEPSRTSLNATIPKPSQFGHLSIEIPHPPKTHRPHNETITTSTPLLHPYTTPTPLLHHSYTPTPPLHHPYTTPTPPLNHSTNYTYSIHSTVHYAVYTHSMRSLLTF